MSQMVHLWEAIATSYLELVTLRPAQLCAQARVADFAWPDGRARRAAHFDLHTADTSGRAAQSVPAGADEQGRRLPAGVRESA